MINDWNTTLSASNDSVEPPLTIERLREIMENARHSNMLAVRTGERLVQKVITTEEIVGRLVKRIDGKGIGPFRSPLVVYGFPVETCATPEEAKARCQELEEEGTHCMLVLSGDDAPDSKQAT